MLLSIKHLSKKYGNVHPIKDISFDVEKGEAITIIGPSGTGKSTLLRMINLLELPTSGEINFDEKNICDKSVDAEEVRKKIGMVFQSFYLFPNMTVVENITMAPIKLLKMDKKEAYDKAIELLKIFGLENKAFSYPDNLSGGQKQRVAIARTLAMQPEIILFDEPTSALDPNMVGEVIYVLKSIVKRGYTILIVTHEMRLARDVSSRVLYVDEGIIYEDGTPEQIFDNPQREKTKAFIKRWKKFEKHITKENFDFVGIMDEIVQFGQRLWLSTKQIMQMQLVFEEGCLNSLQNILEKGYDANFVINYSETEKNITIEFDYSGEKKNIIDSMDEISKKLLGGYIKEVNYSFDGRNRIVARLIDDNEEKEAAHV